MRFGAALVAIARYYLRLPEVQIQGADWPGAGSYSPTHQTSCSVKMWSFQRHSRETFNTSFSARLSVLPPHIIDGDLLQPQSPLNNPARRPVIPAHWVATSVAPLYLLLCSTQGQSSPTGDKPLRQSPVNLSKTVLYV